MAYTLTQAEYRNAKTALTRARNTGDPVKILATVRAARELFDAKGYPDAWADWRRTLADIYPLSPAAMAELTAWD